MAHVSKKKVLKALMAGQDALVPLHSKKTCSSNEYLMACKCEAGRAFRRMDRIIRKLS